MASSRSARIQDQFANLTDPLLDLVSNADCAVICGADDFVAIADWAQE